MTAQRWVIGRGLLGGSIAEATVDEVFRASVPWGDTTAAVAALEKALGRFVEAGRGRPLQVLWCAGRGVTSTGQAALDAELAVFTGFVEALAALDHGDRARLTVFLASSVGGAYGGAPDPPFTESTETVPSSPYGVLKLAMEERLRAATASGGWRSVVGRITNLYGPGQDLSKLQGLVSVVVSSSILGRPVEISVPLDTLRDYIYQNDAAAIILGATERAGTMPSGSTTVKIIGSMTAVSIGAVLEQTRRLRRQRFPVILSGAYAAGQASDLRVRSEIWTDLDDCARTTFAEGVAAVFRAQIASHTRR